MVPGPEGVLATGIADHDQPEPGTAAVKTLQYQSPALIAQAQALRFDRGGAHAARGSQGTTWQASQRIWLPPVAGPWCDVIAGTGYIKSANDESLARDEGGGRNLFMEVATYKTVQLEGRRLRMTPATASQFSPLWMQLCAEQPSSEGGHGGVYDDQAARITTRLCELSPADRDRQLRHPKGVCGDVLSRCR